MNPFFSYKLLMQFPEKMFFSKRKDEIVFSLNYKKFDNSAFREALNRELLKYDLNNIEYDLFQEIVVSLLQVYSP